MTILILSFTSHQSDPRVYRQIDALMNEYEVATAGLGKSTLKSIEHIGLSRVRNTLTENFKTAIYMKTQQYEKRYWGQQIVRDAYEKISRKTYRIIIANDLETLPLALKIAKICGAKVHFDAHEYEPKVQNDRLFFNFFFSGYYDYLCRTYIRSTDSMTTVCEGIAAEYRSNYSVKPQVLINAPLYKDLKPSNIKSGKIRLIHHGIINRSRQIENMIHMVGNDLGDKYSLDLMLVNTDNRYMKFLQNQAKKYNTIRFVEPVSMPEISERINHYDIGLFMLPTNSFNNLWALPNKFFEYIQARLAIAIWPSPEMKRLVEMENIGVVADDFTVESMAKKIKRLSISEIRAMKQNAHTAAKKYNAELCSDQLISIVANLDSARL